MKKLITLAFISLTLALCGCSKGSYRIKEVKSETAVNTYNYYDSGALESIITTDENGEETLRREFSEEGKLTKAESSAAYYPALKITGDLSYSRYDTEVGLEYDSDGNPSKCYQVQDGKKTFLEDIKYEKY